MPYRLCREWASLRILLRDTAATIMQGIHSVLDPDGFQLIDRDLAKTRCRICAEIAVTLESFLLTLTAGSLGHPGIEKLRKCRRDDDRRRVPFRFKIDDGLTQGVLGFPL